MVAVETPKYLHTDEKLDELSAQEMLDALENKENRVQVWENISDVLEKKPDVRKELQKTSADVIHDVDSTMKNELLDLVWAQGDTKRGKQYFKSNPSKSITAEHRAYMGVLCLYDQLMFHEINPPKTKGRGFMEDAQYWLRQGVVTSSGSGGTDQIDDDGDFDDFDDVDPIVAVVEEEKKPVEEEKKPVEEEKKPVEEEKKPVEEEKKPVEEEKKPVEEEKKPVEEEKKPVEEEKKPVEEEKKPVEEEKKPVEEEKKPVEEEKKPVEEEKKPVEEEKKPVEEEKKPVEEEIDAPLQGETTEIITLDQKKDSLGNYLLTYGILIKLESWGYRLVTTPEEFTTKQGGEGIRYAIQEGNNPIMHIGLYTQGYDAGMFYIGLGDEVFSLKDKHIIHPDWSIFNKILVTLFKEEVEFKKTLDGRKKTNS